jgi:hypothetical protein
MTSVGGSAPAPKASGTMPQKLESDGTPAFAWAALTISRITPFCIVT